MTAVLLLAALTACGGKDQNETPPRYLGFWESTYRNPQSGGNSLELLPDSTAHRYFVTMEKLTYHVSGDTLYTRLVLPESLQVPADSVPEMVFTFEFVGDTLHRQGEGRDLWLVRAEPAPDSASGLEGTWLLVRSNSPLTVRSFERYNADSTVLLRLPVASKAGRYRGSADSLTLFFPGEDSIPLSYRFMGDTLEITDTKGYSYTYLPAGDRAWYPMLGD